ncbi:MAG: hypothetical protein AB7G75_10055 [Candidatus Binatia bacterium]
MSADPLLSAAVEIAKAADHVADANLPGKLAGIVKLHAGINAGSGFIPIPGADMAVAVGNTWTMYGRINAELGVPISQNVLRSVAAGILTNLIGTAGMVTVASAVLKYIPGLGFGAMVVMSATLFGITIVAGIIYMNVIARLLNAQKPLNEANLNEAVSDSLKDEEALRKIIKEQQKNYRKEK